nr:hypothetical protein [Tanacetum cinerariifolium]
MAGLATQARTTAVRAGLGAEELGQLFAHGCRFGFPIAALKVRDDALERVRALNDVATVIQVTEVDVLGAAAVEQNLL